MSRKKKNLKITKEDQIKFSRKARREAELEQGAYRPSVVHKTSKTDAARKEPKTVKDYEEDT